MARFTCKSRKGFSLIELLIVIAIIGIIATIAIPILLSARVNAVNEKARNSLRSIVSGEAAYYAAVGSYGTGAQLTSATPPYLDLRFAANGPLGAAPGEQGITFAINPAGQTFTATCGNPSGAPYIVYSTDATGQITP